MSKTTNYNFDKQKWGHQIREDDLNRIAANLDLIDTAIHDREVEYGAHDTAKTGVHGVGSDYIAKVSNSDQKLRIVDFPAAEFDAANKIPLLDASTFLKLAQIVGNVPSLDGNGKLILTGTSQIGTKATDLAALWDKTTKIAKADLTAAEFNAANGICGLDASADVPLAQIPDTLTGKDADSVDGKEPGTIAGKIPYLDASAFLTLSQVVGNIPALDVNGKLVLTGSGQIGTKTADLAELWSKGTLIDDSMIGLNEIHAEGSSNFAGPGGVTITHNLNLSNYAPHIIPTADPAGALGEVWITDVAVNSFVVRNSGIAVTSFTWVIHNRT